MVSLCSVPDRPNAVVTAIGKLLVKVAGKVPLLDGGPIGERIQNETDRTPDSIAFGSDHISDDERVPAEFKADRE
jgi:hypothetical protein